MLKHVDQFLVEWLEYALEPRPRRLLKRRMECPPILAKNIAIGSKLNRLFFVENDVIDAVVHSSQEGHGICANLYREVHKGRRVDIQEL